MLSDYLSKDLGPRIKKGSEEDQSVAARFEAARVSQLEYYRATKAEVRLRLQYSKKEARKLTELKQLAIANKEAAKEKFQEVYGQIKISYRGKETVVFLPMGLTGARYAPFHRALSYELNEVY